MKKALVTLVQVLVTLGLLFWLFHDPQKRADMWSAWRDADRRWLLAGLLVYSFVEILGALRWHVLLRVQGIRIGFVRVMCLFMIGVFFNLFMLGAVGGDVVKVFYLLKETTSQKAAAFLTVLMDRLIGLVALIFLSILIVGPQYRLFLATPSTHVLLVTLGIILASATGGILISFVVSGLNLVHKLPSHLPLHDKFVEMSAAYKLYARAWKATLFGFVVSVLAHLAYFLTFWCAARAFTAEISIRSLFTAMPVVNTITALPISVSGVGVREGLFEQLLGHLDGIPNEVAVLVSLAGFMVIVVWSAIGGLIYLAYRPSDHARLSEMEDTVQHVEETITGEEP